MGVWGDGEDLFGFMPRMPRGWVGSPTCHVMHSLFPFITRGPGAAMAKEALDYILLWCARAPEFSRQRDHVGYDVEQEIVPPRSAIRSLKISTHPYEGRRAPTDVELDAGHVDDGESECVRSDAGVEPEAVAAPEVHAADDGVVSEAEAGSIHQKQIVLDFRDISDAQWLGPAWLAWWV